MKEELYGVKYQSKKGNICFFESTSKDDTREFIDGLEDLAYVRGDSTRRFQYEITIDWREV